MDNFTWFRVKHSNCGGVTSAQFWYGLKSDIVKDLNPPGLYPKRHLIHVLSSASKEFQVKHEPPIDKTLVDSVHEFNASTTSLGRLPIEKILDPIICPSVFSITRWCRRKLSIKEIADVLDVPVNIAEDCKRYKHKRSYLPFLRGVPSKITQFVLQRLQLGNQHDISIINQIHRHNRTPIPHLTAKPVKDEQILKAVKVDDAMVQNSIWDLRLLSIRKDIEYDTSVATKLNKIRSLLVRRWTRNVWESFFHFLECEYGKDWVGSELHKQHHSELNKGISAFIQCAYVARHADWFEWTKGSAYFSGVGNVTTKHTSEMVFHNGQREKTPRLDDLNQKFSTRMFYKV